MGRFGTGAVGDHHGGNAGDDGEEEGGGGGDDGDAEAGFSAVIYLLGLALLLSSFKGEGIHGPL